MTSRHSVKLQTTRHYVVCSSHSLSVLLETLMSDTTDWYLNKKGMPWFWSGINRHFSKMSSVDWQLTPNNTNINKSAHTLTNKYTNTGLSLLEAIARYVINVIRNS